MSSKLKRLQTCDLTKTKRSLKLKSHQNWNVTKTEMSPKLKCYQNWNITKKNATRTKMSQNIKMPKNPNLSHNQNPGDRHRSPWSCFFFGGGVRLTTNYFVISRNVRLLSLVDLFVPFSCTRFWGLFCPHFLKLDVQNF